MISAGHFHGMPLALAMSYVKAAIPVLASISERRLNKLVDPATNDGLPAFLIGNEDGTDSGFMIVQYTAAALVNDLATRAHPASVYSMPTSANAEDHVSMGANEARHVLEMTEDLGHVLALELYTAAQALDYRQDMLNAARRLATRGGWQALAAKIANAPREGQPHHAQFVTEVQQLAAALANADDFHAGAAVREAHAILRGTSISCIATARWMATCARCARWCSRAPSAPRHDSSLIDGSKTMSLIQTPVSYGELIDKITILEIKSRRIADAAKLANVRNELDLLNATWADSSASQTDISDERARLLAVNELLWDIEDKIRLKERAQAFDQEFIELARAVYFRNDERAAFKREINLKLGSQLVEEKSYQDYRAVDAGRRAASTAASRTVARRGGFVAFDHVVHADQVHHAGFLDLAAPGISLAGLPRYLRAASSYLFTHQRRSEYGPERSGLLAACRPSTLVPTALAMCIGPESGVSSSCARPSRASSFFRVSLPVRSSGCDRHAASTASAISRSKAAGPPTRATRQPRAAA